MDNHNKKPIVIDDDDDDEDIQCLGSRNIDGEPTPLKESLSLTGNTTTTDRARTEGGSITTTPTKPLATLALRPGVPGFRASWNWGNPENQHSLHGNSQPSTPSPRTSRIEPEHAGSMSHSGKKRARPTSQSVDQGRSSRPPPIFDLTNDEDRHVSTNQQGMRVRGRSPTAEELDYVFVDVSDDEDLIDSRSNVPTQGIRRLTADFRVIDLDDMDEEFELEILKIEEAEEKKSRRKSSVKLPPRNDTIKYPWREVKEWKTDTGLLKPGKVVELKEGDFLHILKIVRNSETGILLLRGHTLQRTRDLQGYLPRKTNEVCFRFEIEADDNRHCLDQSVVEKHLNDVVRLRHVLVTNQLFPAATFRDLQDNQWTSLRKVEKEGPLTIRWKFCTTYSSGTDRFHNRDLEKAIERLTEEDLFTSDVNSYIARNIEMRSLYRGETVAGGSHIPRRAASAQIDLTDGIRSTDIPSQSLQATRIPPAIDLSRSSLGSPPEEGLIRAWQPPRHAKRSQKPLVRARGQKYTYGDGFCGAGGATRGAAMAGLQVMWGFDKDSHACNTWRLNFPNAQCFNIMAHEFVPLGQRYGSVKVDILHMSPPCQIFSPAHTVDGRDDEDNEASLFACAEILNTVRPRVATLEQTFGICFDKYRGHFRSLIHMFTGNGYSIRWRVVKLQNWGLPQSRHRLIMIASCPGELLPEFPPFTHADTRRDPSSTLLPYRTVNSVLASIPVDAEDHDIAEQEARWGGRRAATWDGDWIAPRCITTHGGQNYHPSGLRGFTNREFASLQGFPHDYRFSDTNVKKQIGNAVPPLIGKVLFESIRQSLERADGVVPESIEIDD